MTLDQVVKHYRGNQSTAARELGVTRAALSIWGKRGRIPYLTQCMIEVVTKGALKANPRDRL
jgi:DNA-binding transcriptional regulator YdaS (Cro superfamily)